MRIIVDANIVISILISRTGTKQELLFSGEIEPISTDWMLFEIGKYWHEICDKSGFEEEDIYPAFSLLRQRVKIVTSDEYFDKIQEAKNVCPDIGDVEYFALALKFNCPIWSEDKPLKQQQSRVEVLNTRKLLEKLGLIPG